MSEPKRTSLSVQRERAVLVKLIMRKDDAEAFDPLAELRSLAAAAGAIVVDALTQKLRRPVPRTYIGRGKVEELVERVEASEANLIIFDGDLSPGQIRALEQSVNCKILDRSELILDIFAARARTHEAKLQVELAQLQYTAPRLRGMWTHLERIAGAAGGTSAGSVGGIGTRGPGERQIEIDRRIVRNRVALLRREITEIDERKRRTVRSREDQFKVSLVGYTNSGKSTLMNTLASAGQYTADKLFATLDTKTVRWKLDQFATVLLSDTVGFVRDLPHRLVASFRATLEEVLHADLLLHVIDASSPNALRQVIAVDEVLHELGCTDVTIIGVLNKMDVAQNDASALVLEARMAETHRVSAMTGAGLDVLIESVHKAATSDTARVTLRFPVSDGRLSAAIDRETNVLERRYLDDTVEMDVAIDRGFLTRLMGRHDALKVVSGDEMAEDAGT